MNNNRRRELNKAGEKLRKAINIIESGNYNIDEVKSILKEASEIIDVAATEERDGFDNLSDGLQQTMRGQKMEEAADLLDEAIESIDNAIDTLTDKDSTKDSIIDLIEDADYCIDEAMF